MLEGNTKPAMLEESTTLAQFTTAYTIHTISIACPTTAYVL